MHKPKQLTNNVQTLTYYRNTHVLQKHSCITETLMYYKNTNVLQNINVLQKHTCTTETHMHYRNTHALQKHSCTTETHMPTNIVQFTVQLAHTRIGT